MRLDQFVSQAMNIPRSVAQRLIRAEQVTVNNAVLRQPSLHIDMNSPIYMDNQLITLPQSLYLMLNKPLGVVSATEDAHERTVMDLIEHPWRHTLHVVGRLDKDTTGLLLLTNDGEWSHRITAPRQQVFKVYRVGLARSLSPEAIRQLEQGVLLHGETKPTAPARVELVDTLSIRLHIAEGKYHQVKRMLAAVGNHVEALHREQIGQLVLDTQLASGEWRVLNEIERLITTKAE